MSKHLSLHIRWNEYFDGRCRSYIIDNTKFLFYWKFILKSVSFISFFTALSSIYSLGFLFHYIYLLCSHSKSYLCPVALLCVLSLLFIVPSLSLVSSLYSSLCSLSHLCPLSTLHCALSLPCVISLSLLCVISVYLTSLFVSSRTLSLLCYLSISLSFVSSLTISLSNLCPVSLSLLVSPLSPLCPLCLSVGYSNWKYFGL